LTTCPFLILKVKQAATSQSYSSGAKSEDDTSSDDTSFSFSLPLALLYTPFGDFTLFGDFYSSTKSASYSSK